MPSNKQKNSLISISWLVNLAWSAELTKRLVTFVSIRNLFADLLMRDKLLRKLGRPRY
jgi:hypothetical protein